MTKPYLLIQCEYLKSNGKQCEMSAPWTWSIDKKYEKRLCGTHVNQLKRQGHRLEIADDV